jgi:hypothetical protein
MDLQYVLTDDRHLLTHQHKSINDSANLCGLFLKYGQHCPMLNEYAMTKVLEEECTEKNLNYRMILSG